VQHKSNPLTLFAIFWATTYNFKATFHTLIAWLYLLILAKQHLIFFSICKVTDFCEKRHREFARLKNNAAMGDVYWKKPGASCYPRYQSDVHFI